MEAVPKLPMIKFNHRKQKARTSLASVIRNLITTTYNEDGESYSSEIGKFERLRVAATAGISNTEEFLSIMKSYYYQLSLFVARFAIADIESTWHDSYKNMDYVGSLDFEKCNILYNIGCIHSYLGESAAGKDNLKMAVTHFQCAAWCFKEIHEKYELTICLKFNDYSLGNLFSNICLAQAQEFLLQKSLLDQRKPIVVAKITTQLITFYVDILNTLNAIKDGNSIKHFTNSNDFKYWKNLFEFKIAYFKCLMCLYHGQRSEDDKNHSERIAYYQMASIYLNEARQVGKSTREFSEQVRDVVSFSGDIVDGKLKNAMNENEFVYHEKIAPLDTLSFSEGVSLVKCIPFNDFDPEIVGEDIFKRLLPIEVHEQFSVYSERKDKLRRELAEHVQLKNCELDSFLLRYNVTNLAVLAKKQDALAVPQDLADRIARIRENPAVIAETRAALEQLTAGMQKVEQMFTELQLILSSERDEEKRYQDVIGERPISMPVTEIVREFQKLTEFNAKGSESNQILRTALEINLKNLEILNSSTLMDQLPAIVLTAAQNLENNAKLKRLQNVLYKIEEMQEQRANLYAEFREKLNSDDNVVHKILLNLNSDCDIDELFDEEIKKHTDRVAVIEQNLGAQMNILDAFVDVHKESSDECQELLDSFKNRQQTIQSLIVAYDSQTDLHMKLTNAQTFLQKIQSSLQKLIQRAKSVYSIQHDQREAILKSNVSRTRDTSEKKTVTPVPAVTDAVATVAVSQPQPAPVAVTSSQQSTKLKDYLAAKKADAVKKYQDSLNVAVNNNLSNDTIRAADGSGTFPTIGDQSKIDSGSSTSNNNNANSNYIARKYEEMLAIENEKLAKYLQGPMQASTTAETTAVANTATVPQTPQLNEVKNLYYQPSPEQNRMPAASSTYQHSRPFYDTQPQPYYNQQPQIITTSSFQAQLPSTSSTSYSLGHHHQQQQQPQQPPQPTNQVFVPQLPPQPATAATAYHLSNPATISSATTATSIAAVTDRFSHQLQLQPDSRFPQQPQMQQFPPQFHQQLPAQFQYHQSQYQPQVQLQSTSQVPQPQPTQLQQSPSQIQSFSSVNPQSNQQIQLQAQPQPQPQPPIQIDNTNYNPFLSQLIGQDQAWTQWLPQQQPQQSQPQQQPQPVYYQQNAIAKTPVAATSAAVAEPKKPISNIDLLAEIDVAIDRKPLMPTPVAFAPAETATNTQTVANNAVDDNNSATNKKLLEDLFDPLKQSE